LFKKVINNWVFIFVADSRSGWLGSFWFSCSRHHPASRLKKARRLLSVGAREVSLGFLESLGFFKKRNNFDFNINDKI